MNPVYVYANSSKNKIIIKLSNTIFFTDIENTQNILSNKNFLNQELSYNFDEYYDDIKSQIIKNVASAYYNKMRDKFLQNIRYNDTSTDNNYISISFTIDKYGTPIYNYSNMGELSDD